MNNGFGLIGLLISTAIVAMLILGSFHYSNTTSKVIKDNNGIESIIDMTESAKNEFNESSRNILDNLDKI